MALKIHRLPCACCDLRPGLDVRYAYVGRSHIQLAAPRTDDEPAVIGYRTITIVQTCTRSDNGSFEDYDPPTPYPGSSATLTHTTTHSFPFQTEVTAEVAGGRYVRPAPFTSEEAWEYLDLEYSGGYALNYHPDDPPENAAGHWGRYENCLPGQWNLYSDDPIMVRFRASLTTVSATVATYSVTIGATPQENTTRVQINGTITYSDPVYAEELFDMSASVLATVDFDLASIPAPDDETKLLSESANNGLCYAGGVSYFLAQRGLYEWEGDGGISVKIAALQSQINALLLTPETPRRNWDIRLLTFEKFIEEGNLTRWLAASPGARFTKLTFEWSEWDRLNKEQPHSLFWQSGWVGYSRDWVYWADTIFRSIFPFASVRRSDYRFKLVTNQQHATYQYFGNAGADQDWRGGQIAVNHQIHTATVEIDGVTPPEETAVAGNVTIEGCAPLSIAPAAQWKGMPFDFNTHTLVGPSAEPSVVFRVQRRSVAFDIASNFYRQFTEGEVRFFTRLSVSGGDPESAPPRVYAGSSKELAYNDPPPEPQEDDEEAEPDFSEDVEFHWDLFPMAQKQYNHWNIASKWPIRFEEVTDIMRRWKRGTDEIIFTLSDEVLWDDFLTWATGRFNGQEYEIVPYLTDATAVLALHRRVRQFGRFASAMCRVQLFVVPPTMPNPPRFYRVTATLRTRSMITGEKVGADRVLERTVNLDEDPEDVPFETIDLPPVDCEVRVVAVSAQCLDEGRLPFGLPNLAPGPSG